MNYADLPKLNSFEEVVRKDKVYSPTFGLGVVEMKYRDDELIVKFSDRKVRIALEDSDLRLVPKDISPRKRTTHLMTVNGKTMGRKKMIKYMRGEL